MRVAYVVSRFPEVSQTFILRELNAVSDHDGVETELLSLFPAKHSKLHPAARRWSERFHRPTVAQSLRALLWCFCRRPLRLAGSIVMVAAGHAREPRVLLRALATLPLSAAHARTLRELAVDHVHAHWASYPTLMAWVCHRLTGIPYSFTAHAHDLFTHQAFLGRKIRDARFVVTISQFNRDFLRRYESPDTPVHIVHYGVDARRYRFRRRSLQPEGPITALCVAMLQEKKGHRFLLEALSGSAPELERLRLLLVGEGELRKPLERQVERLGLSGRVRFLGILSEEEVAAELDRADIFVLPSIRAPDGQAEGLPVSLIEALAAGLPTVATRLTGTPELVRDGETGLLAEPANVESLRSALVRLVRDGDAAVSMGEEGRRLVEAEFDVHASGSRMVELFREGAGSGHVSAGDQSDRAWNRDSEVGRTARP